MNESMFLLLLMCPNDRAVNRKIVEELISRFPVRGTLETAWYGFCSPQRIPRVYVRVMSHARRGKYAHTP